MLKNEEKCATLTLNFGAQQIPKLPLFPASTHTPLTPTVGGPHPD